MKQQYTRSAPGLEAGFENVHREPVDVFEDT